MLAEEGFGSDCSPLPSNAGAAAMSSTVNTMPLEGDGTHRLSYGCPTSRIDTFNDPRWLQLKLRMSI